jgi:hypothetical protein
VTGPGAGCRSNTTKRLGATGAERDVLMRDGYIFIQDGDKGTFLKESVITSIVYEQINGVHIATITTSELDATKHGTPHRQYRVRGLLAVHELRDHFSQRSSLKLWEDKS